MADQELMDRLDNDFTYHAPKEGQAECYQRVRAAGKALALVVVEEAPPSREMSLALTKIEEAVFWTNAAIARHGR